ncbi:MAG: hypothetical protein QM534_15510 [Sediminibacterium sp.]|nr:hypothetical protein [Sediminibacterium sp.]
MNQKTISGVLALLIMLIAVVFSVTTKEAVNGSLYASLVIISGHFVSVNLSAHNKQD